jgi:hypothetical protein
VLSAECASDALLFFALCHGLSLLRYSLLSEALLDVIPPPCYQQNVRLMLYRSLLVVTVCVYCDISLLTEKASEMHYHSLLFVTVTKSKEC